ncbi:MAG: 4Fe-4S binding protein, partial [Bacteroidales bacterium]|nr:4Fe-4S binding protein [Bacteroidales bacterium]
ATLKGTSAVLFLTEKQTRRAPESACIRCGKCADACPKKGRYQWTSPFVTQTEEGFTFSRQISPFSRRSRSRTICRSRCLR